MKKVCVSFKDASTGAKSEIDNIEIEEGYTPDDYVRDCASNGVDWGEGEITFQEIED